MNFGNYKHYDLLERQTFAHISIMLIIGGKATQVQDNNKYNL